MTPELHIDGRIATITLRRPEQANRLGAEDLAALADHVATVNAASDVLVLQFAAAGKYFCSGYDIRSIGASRVVAFDEMVNAIEDARPVTIARLQGGVYGGATDLALACDFRLGTPAVDMFMPAARLGLHFYQRGLGRYVGRLGLDTAKRLFLTAERIGAQEMKDCGFLTQLMAADELDAAADRLAATLASMAPIPLLGMKKNLNRIARGVLDVDELRADMARAASSDDIKEGAVAWAEKRPPVFSGR